MKMSAELTSCVDQLFADAPRLRNRSSIGNIPHRQWLYGMHLLRGDLTVLAGPHGVGKSSLAIGMSVCLTIDMDLLGETIWGKDNKVLYINGEDDYTEIGRRLDAFCDKHNVSQQSLAGRLFTDGTDNWQMQAVRLLRTEKQTSYIDENGVARLENLLEHFHPDLLVLDPLINFCGGGNIDDDPVMALVMMELKRMAGKFDCAVMIVHHMANGRGLSSVDIRGASTTIVPIPMSPEEAKQLGVLPSDRWRYFRVASKSKLTPPSDDAPLYERVDVELPNAEPLTYNSSDHVRTVVRATFPPASNTQLTVGAQIIRRAILDQIERGKIIDGQPHPYSPDLARSKNRRLVLEDAMEAVRQVTTHRQWHPRDLQAVAGRSIKAMLADGWLVDEEIKKGRFRRLRALRVDWTHTPWPNKEHDPSADAAHLACG
jgi:AAA domain